MLFWKKNKKEKEVNAQPEIKDKVAKGIAVFLLRVQDKFSTFMNEHTDNLSGRTKQIWLVLFCLVFGGLSIYAFIGAFRKNENSSQQIKPAQVSVPKYYDRIGTEIKEPKVSEQEIIRIDRFKIFMDSLSKSPKGRHVYDSILKARPGLMDSIKAIEQIYYSQRK